MLYQLLLPAAGMIKTQKNIEQNDKIKVTLGSKEIMIYNSLVTGFLIEGTARFVKSGSEFDMMKEKFFF